MHILSETQDWLPQAIDILRQGGVVAHATETCYGLACDMTNPEAVARLFAVKDRPAHQPVSALFTSVEDAKRYMEWNAQAEELAQDGLPGPLTIILRVQPQAPHALFPTPTGGATVGVRVSPHPIATALVQAFGTPITTTSANVHGLPNPYSVEDILSQFSKNRIVPDLVIDSGKLDQNPPSTVVDVSDGVKKTRR
jgi:L-threonylcarbamoyladenylate synthase